MNNPPRILIADDRETNRDIFLTRLAASGYELLEACDGAEALEVAKASLPDLILLDVMMPKVDGFEVCRRLKSDTALPFMPIILVTARADIKDIVTGLDAGADEYLTKPVDHSSLLARVRSMLRIKELHDKAAAQAAELASWNQSLEQRVTEQLDEIERIGRLKRFLSPQVADLIVSSGDEHMLDSHRREITVVFCDLRGFTAFSETAEPEEVLAVLREYHGCLGRLIRKFEGTLERFTGDGLMVMFNDPVPVSDPAERATRMALEMRAEVDTLRRRWHAQGHDLGFGVGIALGYATLGRIGLEHRSDYAAVGSVVNVAARLCGEAKDGQVLVDRKVHAAIQSVAQCEAIGELALRGFHRPIAAYDVRSLSAP